MRAEPYRITHVNGRWVLYKRELCASGMWNPLYENKYFAMVEVYLKALIKGEVDDLNVVGVDDVFYDAHGHVVTSHTK